MKIKELTGKGICEECIHFRDGIKCNEKPDMQQINTKEKRECKLYFYKMFARLREELECFDCGAKNAVYVQIRDGKPRLLCNKHTDFSGHLGENFCCAAEVVPDLFIKILSEQEKDRAMKDIEMIKGFSELERETYLLLLKYEKVVITSLTDKQIGALGKLKSEGLCDTYFIKRGSKNFKCVELLRRVKVE